MPFSALRPTRWKRAGLKGAAVACGVNLLLGAPLAQQTGPVFRDVKPISGRLNADYPPAALRAEKCGVVHYEARVESSGEATGFKVLLSYPPKTFDSTVENALRQARFPTGAPDGSPAPYKISGTVKFIIEQEVHCQNGPLPKHPLD